jgi:hypothetical protein
VPPEGNCGIFCQPYIKKIKLKNDDADMTNFMLLCMLLGGGFAETIPATRAGVAAAIRHVDNHIGKEGTFIEGAFAEVGLLAAFIHSLAQADAA